MPPTNLKSIRAGDRVDLAAFALLRWWTGTERHDLHIHNLQPDVDGLWSPGRDPSTGEWHIGLEWPEPRDVCRVVARFARAVPPHLKVQYWRRNWPTPAPERLPGARRGWIGRDDPWHGQWTTVRAEKLIEGDACTFTFDPLDLPELGGREAAERLNNAEHYLARFRRTLKLRLVSGGTEQPLVAEMHAYSTSIWREGQVDVRFAAPGDWSGQAEMVNGYPLGTAPLDFEAADAVDAGGAWRCQVAGQVKGVRLHLLYAACAPDSGDRTLVTLRTQTRSFTFSVADLEGSPIYIKDYGVFITWSRVAVDLDAFRSHVAATPRPIYDRIAEEPEQSLARAVAEIPPLDVTKHEPFGRYVPLGVEAGRQEWALRYNGELFADKAHLKLMGRDAAQLLWPGHQLRFRFGSGDPPDFREGSRYATTQSLLDGWLPVVTSQWLDREIEYTQTAFAALLDGPMTAQDARRGDEDVVAMLRFTLRNTTYGPKRARLWLAIAPQEQVELRDESVIARGRVVPAEPVGRQWRVAPYQAACLRCTIQTGGRGTLAAVACGDEPGTAQSIPTAIAYDMDLAGGEAHSITLAVPFVSLTQAADWRMVTSLDFDDKLADVVAFWRQYQDGGAQVDLPDRELVDFYRAVRVHVAMSVDKDPVSGLYVVPAGTWVYGGCGNEACWQITMLDQAGYHDRAAPYLDTFLRTQGAIKPDGKFISADGALQGLDVDGGVAVRSGFGYNLDHGYIMECLAHHYRVTGDRAWLEQVASNLVAACDFVIRERQSTQDHGPDGQPVPEWGLLPAGHLEDNPEWRHWFAVNAHAFGGLHAIAVALAEIGHPAAERLATEAATYRADIRRAAQRAMVEAPVVRLLDGTYVPHMPPRSGLRGREPGWFREVCYGAIQLLEGNVFAPGEEEMDWVLKDMEDNLFVSREWGFPVDMERDWFSHGGASPQPNLMDIAFDYLRRGQVKHALRAFFNTYALSIYPDVRCFAEWLPSPGVGGGPFYKAPDEARWSNWLRSLLVFEDGPILKLGAGIPRTWLAHGRHVGFERMATTFGTVSCMWTSCAGDGYVDVQLDPPTRSVPECIRLWVRHPEGRRLARVESEGADIQSVDYAGSTIDLAAATGRLQVRVYFDSI